MIYNGSADCKFVRKRDECQARNAERVFAFAGVLPGVPSRLRLFRVAFALPGRSFVLFRSVNVVATYSLTVEQGSMLRLGFRANMQPGRCDVFARSMDLGGKADFSYRGIGSSEMLSRLCCTIKRKKQTFLPPSIYTHCILCFCKNNSKIILLCTQEGRNMQKYE